MHDSTTFKQYTAKPTLGFREHKLSPQSCSLLTGSLDPVFFWARHNPYASFMMSPLYYLNWSGLWRSC